MITREQDENGNWVELSAERRRLLNEEVLGLDPIQQAEIEDINSGKVSGDSRDEEEDRRLYPEGEEL